LRLTADTLSGNTATSGGGGLHNNGNLGLASAILVNSTISGNTAKFGGGIANSGNGGTSDLSLTFVTIADNTVQTGGSGLYYSFDSTTTTTASIIAATASGKACSFVGDGVLLSGGYNLDTDGTCGLGGTGDVSDGEPALEPLAMNAPGTTETHAIGEASDAQQKVPMGMGGCGNTVVADQRGVARPTPATLCDIGAYESEAGGGEPPVCAPPYVPMNEVELNTAIDCVNDAGVGSHSITLAADITLSAATTPFDNPDADEILLNGNGHVLDGDQKGTLLTIRPETNVRVQNITLAGGQGSGGPEGNWGGGVYNRGQLTIENSTLADNTAARGGGIVNHGDGTAAELTIVRSTLSGNGGTEGGGGIYNLAEAGGSALLNMVNSTVSGNSATTGGGLLNEASSGNAGANLVYSTLAQNTATSGGGGIDTLAAGGTSSVTLAATIIYNGPGGSADCANPSGVLISTGYNLAGDGSCNLTQGNDLPAADPLLLPLALNAPSVTSTHALQNGSPAIDRVHSGAAGCGTAITTDQRGAARPIPSNGMCDSGAYEEQSVQPPTAFVVYMPVGLDR
jgi:hypothetical protein